MDPLGQASMGAPQAPVEAMQQPVVGQPPQMGMESPVAPIDGVQAEAPVVEQPQEQWFLKAETGTVYKTPEAAAAGIAEKDRLIERLLSERSNPQPQTPQPQADPQAQFDAELSSIATRLEQKLLRNPAWANSDPEAIREAAQLQAYAVLESRELTRQEYQQNSQKQQFETFVATTPDLQTPLAMEVYERARTQGIVFPTPQAHLDAVHLEMFRRGTPPTGTQQQPQTLNGVQGAMQQPRPIFGGAAGTGAAPASQGTLSPVAQRQIDFAISQGYKGEALERIKQRAMTEAVTGGFK